MITFVSQGTLGASQSVLYASDPLWDGKGCGLDETACCTAIPWFHKTFDSSDSEHLELRSMQTI